ncbi:helix-turn-helix domain-containing protein [Streptomyces sp. NPDC002564]|uniref:transcriptional regulator n=1 Tax=Streptomyces sp. NPDC002564 TaxID=3364649 RepID=UPI0036A0A2EE
MTTSLAELLRELKERSGLSYGLLAKRLHTSTSTVHRYCHDEAVPQEFVTVERFARLCGANRRELVEIHRQWVLADADRGRPAEPSGTSAEPAGTSAEPDRRSPTAATGPGRDKSPRPARPRPARPEPEYEQRSGPGTATAKSPLSPARRRRTALLTAAASVVAIGSVALTLAATGDADRHPRAVGPTAPPDLSALPTQSAAPGTGSGRAGGEQQFGAKGRPGATTGPGDTGESASSDPASRSGPGAPAPGATRGASGARDDGRGPASAGGHGKDPVVPVAARVRPYLFEDDCQHSFLVNRKPNAVPQPPAEQDAPAWVGELGAVSARRQYIEVTLQGLGAGPVVLRDMKVRVRSVGAPPDWNNFQVGRRCGNTVHSNAFDVHLDDATPRATPREGGPGFPYTVSEADPLVLSVTADTKLHDVRWDLELAWSIGARHGVLRLDDQGKPFRTSGREGRPTYEWRSSGRWASRGR